MRIPLVTHPNYSFAFSTRHRFPMDKFGLLLTYLQSVGIAKEKNIFRPGAIKRALLDEIHCPNYVARFLENALQPGEQRALGLPWSDALKQRTLISPNGTLLASKLALRHGVACHLAGGTHHAHYDHPSGFCIFNDLAITAKVLLAQQQVNKIVIFDCDVHQGDGTATMLANDVNAITVSIHCENNFPALKPLSDVDVAIADGASDRFYLDVIFQTFEQVIQQHKPELVIYDAGVDVYQHDPLGRLNISETGIRTRDRFIIEYCKENAIPLVTVIGGGYDNDRKALARRHAIVTEECQTLWQAAT